MKHDNRTSRRDGKGKKSSVAPAVGWKEDTSVNIPLTAEEARMERKEDKVV